MYKRMGYSRQLYRGSESYDRDDLIWLGFVTEKSPCLGWF
jgi:hypothetical protein